MHGTLRPRPLLARPSPASAGEDLEALTRDFLGTTRRMAVGHFREQRIRSSLPVNALVGECRTVQQTVVPRPDRHACRGTLVAHISAEAFAAWAACDPGTAVQREAHVMAQLQLVLLDLADHDVHGCLPLTESQTEVYDLDLQQLVTESLDRTTFAHLRRRADIHWEGTLVQSLEPPALVLVISIDV